jgi:hypothetical protein
MGKMSVAKVTLSTGKVVHMRMLKISDTEVAAQEVAPRSNGDSNVMQLLMQKALVKNLLLKYNDKDLSAAEKEDMDGLFSMAEYNQLIQVVKEMGGGDDLAKKPQLEVVSSGDN